MNFLCITLGYAIGHIVGKNIDKIIRIREAIINENMVMAWIKTIKTVARVQYTWIHDEYVKKVKQPVNITPTTFDIEYFIGSNKYVIRVKIEGPSTFKDTWFVYDENGKDVTSMLTSFLGPHKNFHTNIYTPKDLGFTKLTVLDEDWNETVYAEGDLLKW